MVCKFLVAKVGRKLLGRRMSPAVKIFEHFRFFSLVPAIPHDVAPLSIFSACKVKPEKLKKKIPQNSKPINPQNNPRAQILVATEQPNLYFRKNDELRNLRCKNCVHYVTKSNDNSSTPQHFVAFKSWEMFFLDENVRRKCAHPFSWINQKPCYFYRNLVS